MWQGELLDQIEYMVNQSLNMTGKAVVELQKAREYQKSARKKMCCLVIIFLVILAIILGPALGSSGSNA